MSTAVDFYFTAGDQNPPLALQFKDANGNALDLTGRTATATLRHLSNGLTVTLALTPRAQTGEDVGWADYAGWSGSEFDLAGIGYYDLQGRAEAVGGGGGLHVPNDGTFLLVRVGEALDAS